MKNTYLLKLLNTMYSYNHNEKASTLNIFHVCLLKPRPHTSPIFGGRTQASLAFEALQVILTIPVCTQVWELLDSRLSSPSMLSQLLQRLVLIPSCPSESPEKLLISTEAQAHPG